MLFSSFQQFVWGTFESSYYPTSRKETYYPTVILHDKNYPLKIVDIPGGDIIKLFMAVNYDFS
jgi:hypothetical protein